MKRSAITAALALGLTATAITADLPEAHDADAAAPGLPGGQEMPAPLALPAAIARRWERRMATSSGPVAKTVGWTGG